MAPETSTQPPAASTPAPTGTQPTNGLAIASLIVGIVAFLSGWVLFFGFVVGVAAIILGILGLRKPGLKGMSISGIVTGAVGALWSLVISVIFIIAVATVGITGAALDEALNEANQQAQQQLDGKRDFAKGETARFGNLDIKVDSVTRNFEGNAIFKPEAGKEYIIVNLTATNQGDDPEYVSSFDFKINEGGAATNATLVTVEPNFEATTLNKGASSTGNIVFEVTAGAQDLKLQYETMVFTGSSTETVVYTLAI